MVKRINILDENTSNKIAAGEVVERPASVVKELIENCIDANAKNITIEVRDGGTSLIKITDDGTGIYPDDIEKAFMAHATSKIRNTDDIFAIKSLGFRGEALPSIASVSKIQIRSKCRELDSGIQLNIEGGEVIDKTETACADGTIIEVNDLFYNVPARKKFLKSTSREMSLISDIVNRIAICYPEISFKLYNGTRKVLHTYGTGNLIDVLRTIYGKTICEQLIYFEEHNDIYSVYGYIGKEEISRGSRNNQSIFVNKRYVKDRKLTVAVENAFKSFSTVNKFPFFILFVESYPELIDVNIHPTKSEIKFKDDRTAFKIIFDTVHKALRNDVMDTFMEDISLVEEKKEYEDVSFLKEDEKVNLFNESVRKIENFTPQSVKEEVLEAVRNVSHDNYIIPESRTTEYIPQITEERVHYDINNAHKEDTNVEYNDTLIPKIPDLRVIGQFDKTYIIAEYNKTLFLIDQHAAHEKCLFENYYNKILNGSIEVQSLLVPELVELSCDDFSIFEENKDVFLGAGFVVEEFGDTTVSIKEVPYFLGKASSRSLFLEIIDNLRKLGSGITAEVKYNRIATKACKAAIKANDELNIDEMYALLEKMKYLDDPYHCPHGRPTIIKFSLNEIEKRFRRIV